MTTSPWETHLTDTSADTISVRGYDLADLIGRVGFPTALLVLYTGEVPSAGASEVVEALMVASIDHGPATPSAQAARIAISGGASLQAAAAAGLLTMGDHHGAAVAACMTLIAGVAADPMRLTAAAAETVRTVVDSGSNVPGFGHRQHKQRDPRVERLFGVAADAGIPDTHVRAAAEVEHALEQLKGRPVPINIDGAMAAILCDIDYPVEYANALFIASRLVGVLGHAVEEQGMTPMRRVAATNHVYAGPSARSLPAEE